MHLEQFLNKYSKMVEPKILRLLVSHLDKKYQGLVKYLILTGGKRLRPALAIISSQMLGGKIKDVLYPAAGLEILHNYTLIVDDIIDNSLLRRGKPTVWAKFGRSMAECAAIAYSAAIFQAANQSNNPAKISEVFAKALKRIAEGEVTDILFEQSGRNNEPYIVKNRYQNITERDYFKMAGEKTASLFEACREGGGISAGASEKELTALRHYGFNLGIAFQIQDDILDIFGKEKSFGKHIGQDIIERKGGNIIILYALKGLKRPDKKIFLDIFRKKKINKSLVSKAIKLIRKTDSQKRAALLGQKFVKKAKGYLKTLPQNQWSKLLEAAADLAVEREK